MRLIDADTLRNKILYFADAMNHEGNHEQAKAFNYCLCMIDDMPTADVVPSKYGCGSAPYCSDVWEVDENE